MNPHERIRLALDTLRKLAERSDRLWEVGERGATQSYDTPPIVLNRNDFDDCISEIANAAQILVPVPGDEVCEYCGAPGSTLCENCIPF